MLADTATPDEPAEAGDLVERPLQACPGDALTAMPLVDEDAGDPPIRPWWSVLSYSRLCLMPGSSSGLPYWRQPWAAPLSSMTSEA